MKKMILALVFGAVFGAGITAIAAEKHVNISDAQDLISKALGRIDDAQKANEFDLGGHAAKAKDLINQAQGELKQAAAAASAADKK